MADGDYGPKYVCTLSDELKAKAKKELNETEKDRPKKINKLREKVLAHPGLKSPLDDLFLLRFLRARKFDVERAYQLLINYFTIRVKHEEHLSDLKPSTVKHVLDAGVSILLPMKDKHGRRIWYYRPGRWDHKEYPVIDLLRANMMAMEYCAQDEATQINGMVAIGDFSGMSLGHVGKFNRTYAQITMELLQDAFPLRFKGMNMCNEALVITYLFPIVKVFMNKKTKERMTFHGEDRKSLHKEFGAAILPEELGGLLSDTTELAESWKKSLLGQESYFENLLKYKIDLPKDIFKKQRDETQAEGVVGSFKKLDV